MPDDREAGSLPIMEETVSISAQKVESGSVRVSTRTETIDHRVPVDLTSVEVQVDRVPVDRKVDAAPEIVTEGDLTIIPVVEERIVVTRELYLREEIHVRRIAQTQHVDVKATTRRQTAHIDRVPADSTSEKDDQDDL